MNLAADILDKYSVEEITAYLDNVLFGVLKNYKLAIEKNSPEILYASLGDLTEVRAVLHEQRKRDQEKQALKQQ